MHIFKDVCACGMHMHAWTHRVCWYLWRSEKSLGPLELRLMAAVSHEKWEMELNLSPQKE